MKKQRGNISATLDCEYCNHSFHGKNRSQAKSGHVRIGHKGWPLHPTEADVQQFKACDGVLPTQTKTKTAKIVRRIASVPAASAVATEPKANGQHHEVPFGDAAKHLEAALSANESRQTTLRAEIQRLEVMQHEDSELERQNVVIREALGRLTGERREVGEIPSLHVHGAATHAVGHTEN